MNIKIRDVEHLTTLEKERVILDVLNDDDIGDYVVMDNSFDSNGDLSNIGRHVYKFPPKPILKGDIVYLYTAIKGTKVTEKDFDNGKNKHHFFYWGRDSKVWNKTGDRCTVLQVHDTKAIKVD